jgi:alpha-galactosidase
MGTAVYDTALRPGEEIRTPRMLLLFWEQARLHGHHLLRQFILAHHTPRPNGRLLQAPVCDSNWGDRMDHGQIAKARWLKAQQIPVEYFWIDAGWYGDAHKEGSDTFGPEWAQQVGNWYPNGTTYPQGLQPVGAALKELGFGLVWISQCDGRCYAG